MEKEQVEKIVDSIWKDVENLKIGFGGAEESVYDYEYEIKNIIRDRIKFESS